jgi:hypothetical protein
MPASRHAHMAMPRNSPLVAHLLIAPYDLQHL